MKKINKTILGSPIYLEKIMGVSNGLKFLCLNVPEPCPYNCKFCAVKVSSPVKNNEVLSNDEISSIIEASFRLGVLSVVIMSDGEPLFSSNLKITKQIAKVTGRLGMYLIINTKGSLLDKELLNVFEALNNKTSFIISINSVSPRRYKKLHGENVDFGIIKKNAQDWQVFLSNHNHANKNFIISRIAFHNIITDANIDEINDLKKFADKIGAVFIATLPFWQGNIIKNSSYFNGRLQECKKIVADYSATGGPAAFALNKSCSYIDAGNKIHGLAVHTRGGVPLLCPYLLENALDWLKIKNCQKISVDDWLLVVDKISRKINLAIFKKFGTHNCLMRHPRLNEIKSFLPSMIKEAHDAFDKTS